MPTVTPIVTASRLDYTKRIKDVVGRLKVSIHENVYEADFEYGKQPMRWEEVTANGGSITHLAGSGGCAMYLPAASSNPNALTIRQSRPYHRYQPGKAMFMATAINFGAPASNQFQRVGFFDDSNGIFFEQGPSNTGNPAGMQCVVRTDSNYFPNGTASTTAVRDLKVDYANWEDPHKIKDQINWNQIQMLWIEYAWYGAGCLRWGVFLDGEQYTLHEIGTGNNPTYGGGTIGGSATTGVAPWARTGNLPVRYEQRDSGAGAPETTMYHYGVSVIVEGKRDEQRGFTYSYGMPPSIPRRYVAPNSTRFPVISVQPRVMGTQEFSNIGGAAASQANINPTGTNNSTLVVNSVGYTLPLIRRFNGFSVNAPYTTIAFRSSHNLPVGVTFTGNTTLNSPSITTTSNPGIPNGTVIMSPTIPVGTTVTNTTGSGSSWTITMSANATANATGAIIRSSPGSVVLTGFAPTSPSNINGTYAYTVASASTIVIPNSTPATTIGTVSTQGVAWATNQWVGRSVYYRGTDGNYYVGKITANSATSITFRDPLYLTEGLSLPVAPDPGTTFTGTITAGSNQVSFTSSSTNNLPGAVLFTGTGSLGASSFTASSTTGLSAGMFISGANISVGVTITGISGNTVSISGPLQAAGTNTAYTAYRFVTTPVSSLSFPPSTKIIDVQQLTSTGWVLILNNPAISSSSTANNITANSEFTIGQVNRGQIVPQSLVISADSLCVVELITSAPDNPVVPIVSDFQPLTNLGSLNSFGTRDVEATSISTGTGEVVYAFTTTAGGAGLQQVDLSNFFPLYNTISGNNPDILTVAISTRATSSPGGQATSARKGTISFTGNWVAGSNQITATGITGGTFAVGMPITGSGITAGATITKVFTGSGVTVITLSTSFSSIGSNVACLGHFATLQFNIPHGLSVGDQIVLADYSSVETSTAWNGTWSVIGIPDSLDVRINMSPNVVTSATTLGNTTFISGASVGAHVICQEAMS